jgi:hypothetical protein
MMGEAYHNNHKNPSATNFGFLVYELDPTYADPFFSWLKTHPGFINYHLSFSGDAE